LQEPAAAGSVGIRALAHDSALWVEIGLSDRSLYHAPDTRRQDHARTDDADGPMAILD
jgi:hypothetical protein